MSFLARMQASSARGTCQWHRQ